jgi:hypothetical protein
MISIPAKLVSISSEEKTLAKQDCGSRFLHWMIFLFNFFGFHVHTLILSVAIRQMNQLNELYARAQKLRLVGELLVTDASLELDLNIPLDAEMKALALIQTLLWTIPGSAFHVLCFGISFWEKRRPSCLYPAFAVNLFHMMFTLYHGKQKLATLHALFALLSAVYLRQKAQQQLSFWEWPVPRREETKRKAANQRPKFWRALLIFVFG